MEVERVTVKFEVETLAGKTSVEATAALDFREGRSKEDAAAADYNLVQAIRDAADAGAARREIPPAPAGWCPLHQVQTKLQTNDRGSWYSHQVAGSGWCKGN